MPELAPIVLFCYNRPDHTLNALQTLSENLLADQSQLFIFCDGPKGDATNEQIERIRSVRKIVKRKMWCSKVEVIESEVNKGLARSIIDGVTQIVNQYGKIIVLEDDLLTTKHFLSYMNNALSKYETCDNVYQVSGYIPEVNHWSAKNISFFLPLTTSWGWATWKRAWNFFDENPRGYEKLKTDVDLKYRFDLYGTRRFTKMILNQVENKSIDSWAICWWWAVFNKNGLVLFPDKSLVNNIGVGKDATHTKDKVIFNLKKFEWNYSIINFPAFVSKDDNRWVELINFYKGLTSIKVEKSFLSFLGRIFKK